MGLTKNFEKKLFLLDGMALAYRAHFAFSKIPRITSTGLNTSAIFGFANTLIEVIQKENPSHLAVVFDTSVATQRHLMFADYKAHREEMPEDLVIGIPLIKKMISGFRIPVITLDGYEADDIIGTLAKKAEKDGFLTYCMTPDKDFGQLVSDQIFIYKPARMGGEVEVLGVNEILGKWEISEVSQVIDILGLWGDAVDNIPGIPGIGEKTAKILIKQYGSVENIIANSHELKGKMKENVENYAIQGILSKKLATIILDVPIEFEESELLLKKPDETLLKPFFSELEFRSMNKRVFGETIDVPSTKGTERLREGQQTDLFLHSVSEIKLNPNTNSSITVDFEIEINSGSMNESDLRESNFKTLKTVPHTYYLVENKEDRQKLLEKLKSKTRICMDTETTSVNANQAELVGLSFSIHKHEGYYVPIPENKEEALTILQEFKEVFEDESIQKIGQNIKYDIIVLAWHGIQVKGKIMDTMLAHYILDPDTRHNMDILSENYLNYKPLSITELIGKKGKNQGSMREVDLSLVTEYASEDADITLQLCSIFEPLLIKAEAESLAEEMEYPLVYVLADMEKEGVKIDQNALNEFSAELEISLKNLEVEIWREAGTPFNISSPKQLGEILFDKLKLDPKAKKTKTGQYQTGEDVLSYLAPLNPIVSSILDFRSLQKLKSTYVDALPTMINPKTGRIHTSYNQAVAATGRLSSNNPNLQNIPIRTEKGREVRKAFIPKDDNHILVSADYSQIELRIIAEISKDPAMMEAFAKNLDIHQATASKVYGVPLQEVTSTMRRNAKSVNFGIIYGQSAFGLSQNLGIPRKEASEIITQYFAEYPLIKKYMDDTIHFARTHGYVETLMKRRRYLRDIHSANHTVRGFAERNAINAPIQGSAADLIKLAMIGIFRDFKNHNIKSKMTMQVHDELVFDVKKEELEIVKPIIELNMRTAIKTTVPLVVEIGSGKNWLEAH